MKLLNIVAILLIVLGTVSLSYEGFNYTKRNNVAQIGDVKITADTEKRVHVPPIVGGVALTVGIILLVMGRRKF